MATKRYDDLTKEELIRLLQARDQRDATRFGLVWEANEIERDKALNSDFVALDLDEKLSCGPNDGPWKNLIIEGDNFDALRYLRMTFAGRVKCILIDPPYNTGRKDFVYNDHYVGEEDLWRFSTWIEFLSVRLTIARDLLRDDGVLLCCINDDNRAKVELLLDKVMPGMRIGTMAWRTRDSTSAKGRNFSDTHEHILVYGGKAFQFRGREKSTRKYKNPDNDPRGPWNADPLTLGLDRFQRENLYYPIQNPKTGRWYPCDPNLVWRYASEKIQRNLDELATETMEEWIRQDKIIFPAPEDETVFRWNTMDALLRAIDAREVPVTPKKKLPLLARDLPNLEFWVGKDVGSGRPTFKKHWRDLKSHTSPVGSWIARMNEDGDDDELTTLRSREAGEGTGVLQQIFGRTVFNYPKPPSLFKQLVEQATDLDSVVLDFFAGSGTTCQAVLEQNATDGGTRQFIAVSNAEQTPDNPDRNICRDVCAARVRAIVKGYSGVAGTGGDFAYLRCRRIHPGRLTEIDHAQVWTALQLTHCSTLAPFQEKARLSIADHDDGRLIYVPHLLSKDAKPLRQAVREAPEAAVIIYSWQPELVRQKLVGEENVQIEAVPESLARRFGMRV